MKLSANGKAAEEILEPLEELIVEENCFPGQIFSIYETSQFWKWMPAFTHKEAKSMPVFKAFKDRITDLLGDNNTAYTLTPFAIWHSELLRSFKHISKHTPPVFYRRHTCPGSSPQRPPELPWQQSGGVLFGE